MSKNSKMANVKASQDWTRWMETQYPDQANRRKQAKFKPQPQQFDVWDDEEWDYDV
jgi:hypothetical protein